MRELSKDDVGRIKRPSSLRNAYPQQGPKEPCGRERPHDVADQLPAEVGLVSTPSLICLRNGIAAANHSLPPLTCARHIRVVQRHLDWQTMDGPAELAEAKAKV